MKTRKYGINPLFDCFHASYLPILMEIGTEVLIPKIAYIEFLLKKKARHFEMPGLLSRYG